MPKIEMYTKAGCAYCERAKQFFGNKKLTFTEIRVDENPERFEEMMARSRGVLRTVPQIYVNDRFIGGFDDMVALDQAGKLAVLLSE